MYAYCGVCSLCPENAPQWLAIIPSHSHENIPPLSASLMSMAHSDSRQPLLFDADKEGRADPFDDSQDSIEMSTLDEIPVTPAHQDAYGRPRYDSDDNDSDGDSDVEDHGDQALLGSRSRSRGRDRTEEHPTDTLSQVKRIVLEVRGKCLSGALPTLNGAFSIRLHLHYY